jgi:serine/threonine-protein kinase HipA
MTEAFQPVPTAARRPQTAYGPRSEWRFDITLGDADLSLGELVYIQDGATSCSRFTFHQDSVKRRPVVNISPDLRNLPRAQWRKPPPAGGTAVFAALFDTQPDGFARDVVARALELPFMQHHPLQEFEPLDLRSLCAVHDLARLGALRVRPRIGSLSAPGRSVDLACPADLDAMLSKVEAFERGCADLRQIQLLLGCCTSLGGSRPKASVFDIQGTQYVAKLRSVFDEFPVNKAEMLASLLARSVGIATADLRIQYLRTEPHLISPRFDRDLAGRRLYLSARSLLLAEEGEVFSVLELLHAMRLFCVSFEGDAPRLWMRCMFRLLLNNLDPSLHKIGFLKSGPDKWYLAPATGIRPAKLRRAPSRAPWVRELGPECSVDSLLEMAGLFGVSKPSAAVILTAMVKAINGWKKVATEYPVCMKPHELVLMEPVMHNANLDRARSVISGV